MNDIEAAEREAFAKYITSQEHIGFDAVVWRGIGGDPLGVLHEPEYSESSLRSEWAAWLARSALAHATRGEGEERPVHRDDEWWIRRINEAHKHGGLPWLVTVAKNFPRDEGASATPPPATGMKCWRDVEGTLPARRDGDKVARVDPETAIPATGKPWCRLCCGPHIGRDHVLTPYADEPPATGEAGMRGEPFGGYERERAAFDAWWADKSDGYKRATGKGANLSGVAWDAYYARATRALPEAREGESKTHG